MLYILNELNLTSFIFIYQILLLVSILWIRIFYKIELLKTSIIAIYLGALLIIFTPSLSYKFVVFEIFAALMIIRFFLKRGRKVPIRVSVEKFSVSIVGKIPIFLILMLHFIYFIVAVLKNYPYSAFEAVSFGGEDSAQYIDSLSKLNHSYPGESILERGFLTPGISSLFDLLQAILTIYFKPNLSFNLLLILLIVIYTALYQIFNYTYGDLRNLITYLLALIIYTLVISIFIYQGHYHFLFCVLFFVWALNKLNENSFLINTIYIFFPALFWWPAIIVSVLIFLYLVKVEIVKRQVTSSNFQAYIGILFVAVTTPLSIFVWFSSEIKSSQWEFDILRDSGGTFKVTAELWLVVIIFFVSKYLISLKENHINNLNSRIWLILLLGLVSINLFYQLYIASATTYGYLKLESLIYFIILLGIVVTNLNYKGVLSHEKMLVQTILVLILLNNSSVSDAFIKVNSLTNNLTSSYINRDLYQYVSDNRKGDLFCLIKSEGEVKSLESYICSRWISSIQGKDDRNIRGAMGWRFYLLGRVEFSEFYEKNPKIFEILYLNGSSFKVLDKEEMLDLL